MLKERIFVGKAYVSARNRVLREVVEELDGQRVKFNAFELESGRLLPSRHRICGKREMAAWAAREASRKELARIHPFERLAWFEARAGRDDRGIQLAAAKAALEAVPGPHLFPAAK